jgi:hypothetical protein
MFKSLAPLSAQRHAGRGWERPRTSAFAAESMVEPVVGGEIAKAMHSFPIAFRLEDKGFMPVAILGLEPGRNLFVAADGRWIGDYIPAGLRAYPFVQAKGNDGRMVMCIDEGSGLLTESPAGEPLFDQDGQLSESTRPIAELLRKLEQSRIRTRATVARLADAGVIVPWPLSVSVGYEHRNITGLFRIDDTVLRTLPDAVFLALRPGGALALAYAQHFSMTQISILEKLAKAETRLEKVRQQRLAGSFVEEPADDLAFDFGGIE